MTARGAVFPFLGPVFCFASSHMPLLVAVSTLDPGSLLHLLLLGQGYEDRQVSLIELWAK